MHSFFHKKANLSKISEDSDDNDDLFPLPKRSLRSKIGSWKDGFDEYEDYKQEEDNTYRIYKAGKQGPFIFCIHGAGATGVSFTLLAKNVKSFCRIVAPDLRGHGLHIEVLLYLGNTHVKNEKDLSAKTLTDDCIDIINHVFSTTEKDKETPIILIGHSMGGGIAVHIANDERIKDRIKGLIVVDVVEGTAVASLNVMTNVLKRRPQEFYDIEDAINWSLDSQLLHNPTSARISIPDQLVKKEGCYVWRTDLFDTQPYWMSWYENMSERFLQAPAIKVLLLAGRERLDTPLTIGQMQGKFQMILFNGMGHYIHEDAPEEVGRDLQRYLTRYNFLGNLSEEDALKNRIQRERAALYG